MAERTVSSGWTWTSGGSRSRALRRHHLGDRLAPGPDEAVVRHPVVVVDLGQVAPAGVGKQDHDDVVGAEVLAEFRAAHTAVPHDPPARMPSSLVIRLAVRNESRSLTMTTRSTTEGS